MFDPLGLAKGNCVALQFCKLGDHRTYHAVTHTFTIPYSLTSITRYRLQENDGTHEIELEVSKDREQNFHICAYELIEVRDFSAGLLSILGTETIGFMPQNQSALTNRLYHRILAEDEQLETCKYLCDEDDLEELPENLGYTRDGNGNWYMMMQRSGGKAKHFYQEPPKRCWEYEDENGQRLLIELNSATESEESNFGIYLGRKILREELHILSPRDQHITLPSREQEVSLSL